MHFGFMNVILLYNDHRHVSTARVTIFREVSATILSSLLCKLHHR